MNKPLDNKKCYCNTCLGYRKHTVLYSKNQHHEDYRDGGSIFLYYEDNNYILAECNGCEHITLVIETTSSADSEIGITYYPPKVTRKEPKWLYDLMINEIFLDPYKYDFLKEIYNALSTSNLRLAVIGIRSLLEQIMIEKVGDNKTFAKNLDKFQSEGYMSKVQQNAIKPVIEAGHASTHRGFKATADEVCQLMDIVENLIESIYINQNISSRLKIPKRKS
jgi:hypothetical protein